MANLSNIKVKFLNKDIASIIISEPKTYNALSLKNLGDLIKAFKKLDEDKNIKVIIIEGSGKGFSAGHNLKEVSGLKKREKYQKLFNLCSKLMLQIVEGKFKVIMVPNITNICYGRGVGYKIEEVVLSEEIQQISATKIRAKMREDGKLK